MTNKTEHIFEETSCIPLKDLMAYQEGKLSLHEVHQVEKHLTDCMFCNDALEGFALVGNPGNIENIVSDLNAELKLKVTSEPTLIDKFQLKPYMSIAASIVIVLTFAFILKTTWFDQQEDGNMAFNESTSVSESEEVKSVPEREEPLPVEKDENESLSNDFVSNDKPTEIDDDEIGNEKNSARLLKDSRHENRSKPKLKTKAGELADNNGRGMQKDKNLAKSKLEEKESEDLLANNSGPGNLDEDENASVADDDFEALTSTASGGAEDKSAPKDTINISIRDNIAVKEDEDDSSIGFFSKSDKKNEKSEQEKYYKYQTSRKRAGSNKNKKVSKQPSTTGLTGRNTGYTFEGVKLMYSNKEYQVAVIALNSLLLDNPTDKNLNYTLGLCYLQIGKTSEAKKIFKPLSVKSKRANYFNGINILEIYDLIDNGKISKAIKTLEKKILK